MPVYMTAFYGSTSHISRAAFFIRPKNYHIGDLNLFYLNIRENAALRVAAYRKKNGPVELQDLTKYTPGIEHGLKTSVRRRLYKWFNGGSR